MSHLGRPKGPDPAFSLAPVEAWACGCPTSGSGCSRTRASTRARRPTTWSPPSWRRAAISSSTTPSVGPPRPRVHEVARLLSAYAGLLLLRELEELGRCSSRRSARSSPCWAAPRWRTRSACSPLGERRGHASDRRKMAEEVERGAGYELPEDVVAAAAFEPDAEARRRRGTRSGGWLGSTSARRRGTATRRASPGRAPSSGTARWASSSGRLREGRRRGRGRGGRRAHTVVGGRLRSGPRSSSRRAIDWISTGAVPSLELLEARSPASAIPSMSSRHITATLPRTFAFRDRLEPVGGPRRPRREDMSVLIAGNWKMFKGPGETAAFCAELPRRPRR